MLDYVRIIHYLLLLIIMISSSSVSQQCSDSHKHISKLAFLTLHYITVIYSGLSTRLLNHYYTRCTELETANSQVGNDPEKRLSFEAALKNSQRWS